MSLPLSPHRKYLNYSNCSEQHSKMLRMYLMLALNSYKLFPSLGNDMRRKNVHMTEVYQSVTDKTDRTFGRHYNTGRL